MKQIAIDLGTSFIKYAVIDMELGCLLSKHKSSSIPKIPDNEGKFELSAKAIVKQVYEIIMEIISEYQDIQGIIFSTQMHGFIFQVDGDTDPHYVSWQDQRSLHQKPDENRTWLDYLKEMFNDNVMQETGVHIKTALSLCNLYVLIHEEYGKCPDGEFFTLGSYIIRELTGNNCCHITNAAPSGMVNIYANQWSDRIIQKAGFQNIRFPKILTGFESCGTLEINGKNIQVFADYGDQQATVLGCKPQINDLVLNIGTAAQISQIVDRIIPDSYEVRPFFEETFLNTYSNLPGGRNFEIFLDFIMDICQTFGSQETTHERLWNILDSNDGWQSEGLETNLNFYSMKDGSASYGSISNITSSNFRGKALTAAVYKDIADDYYSCALQLTRKNPKPKRLLFAGGKLARQKALIKAVSKIFNIPVLMAPESDTVFDGLYRILQVCCGEKASLADTSNLVMDKEK